MFIRIEVSSNKSDRLKYKLFIVGIACLLISSPLLAQRDSLPKLPTQRGIGIRFATDLTSFQRPLELNFVPGWFSTGKIGVFYKQHSPKSGFDIGLNLNYKQGDDKGFPNLPVIMQDFQEGQQTGLTSIEMDLKVGPRFLALHPRIGYIVGYRFEAVGYQRTEDLEINKWYVHLPFGASYSLPTNFGTVGIGAFYLLGITNVLKDPDPGSTQGLFNGGRMNIVNLEILVTFDRE